MEKYSYVRFTKLNGDEYWQIKVFRPWYKFWKSKWASKGIQGMGGSYSYVLQFQTQQDAEKWVKEDIANDLEVQGLRVVRVDEFKPQNSMLDELIKLNEGL